MDIRQTARRAGAWVLMGAAYLLGWIGALANGAGIWLAAASRRVDPKLPE